MNLKTMWTAVGMAKRANAEVLGSLVEITYIAFGDAGGNNAFEPDQDMAVLVNEVYRRPVDFVQVDDVNPSWVNVEGHILADDGGWWVREIGLFDAVGDLVAVGNCSPRYKPLLAEGESADQYFRLILLTSNTAVIQPKINPAMALASRKYVDDGGAGWKASHIRVVTESGPVLATDRFLSVDATAADVTLTLFAANAATARRLELHREDDTANKVNLLVVTGTICRGASLPECLTVQDEILVLIPKATINNWLRV
jgi:phage-related tail fiber protein